MHLHEYQSKEILERYGIAISPFSIVSSKEEVDKALDAWPLEEAAIKIQVHAGGRGKAGGVKIAKNREEIRTYAGQLIGMRVINQQTGSQGVVAEKVMITPLIRIVKEFYIAAIIDRKEGIPLIIASPEGGMEIEEIAQKHPERLLKEPIPLSGKLRSYQCFAIAKFMGWQGPLRRKGMELVANVARAFIEIDASLLEINPLVQTEEGGLLALDAKCTIDDNALFRHPEIAAMYDPTQETKGEVMAKEFDLAYIGLEGTIGCMVNGAGLAMATMDIIDTYGGKPANFLDVGGGATAEKVAHGFRIILLDPHVKSIFVNIFGGIMDCAVLAQGIIQASKEGVRVPLIVRMEGTNVEKGKRLLRESGLNIITADTMADGAEKAVKAARRD